MGRRAAVGLTDEIPEFFYTLDMRDENVVRARVAVNADTPDEEWQFLTMLGLA